MRGDLDMKTLHLFVILMDNAQNASFCKAITFYRTKLSKVLLTACLVEARTVVLGPHFV